MTNDEKEPDLRESEIEQEDLESNAGAEETAADMKPENGVVNGATLAAQLEKSRDEYLRLAAEFDNYKKRTARDFSNLVKTANEGLIVDLLEVLDNFERASKSLEENPDAEAYHKGISLVYDRLAETLSREGLKRFDSVGHPFDPRYHEAIMQVDDENAKPDTVAIEIQAGYTLNDKVIRHARVGVVKGKES